MNYCELTLDWLSNCQQEDGAWTSEEFRSKPLKNLEDQLIHKIAYTSRVLRTLGMFGKYKTNLDNGCIFLLNCDSDLKHPLYEWALKIVAFSAVNRHELVLDRVNRLISIIQSGGMVSYDARREAVFFDNCITLDAILSAASIDRNILDDDRVRDLIGNIAQSINHGDKPDYWFWRMALLSKAKKLGSKISDYPSVLASFQNKLKSLQASYAANFSFEDINKRRTRTPNLFCRECRDAHNIINLVEISCEHYIDNDFLLPMIRLHVNHLLGLHNVNRFYSDTFLRNNTKKRVSDPYVNALIIAGLNNVFASKILGETPLGKELNDFWGGRIDNVDDLCVSVKKYLNEIPDEVREFLKNVKGISNTLNIMLQESSEPKIEAEIGTSGIISKWLGFSAKLKVISFCCGKP